MPPLLKRNNFVSLLRDEALKKVCVRKLRSCGTTIITLLAEFIRRVQGQAKSILGSYQESKGIFMVVCAKVPEGREQNNSTNAIAEG